MSASRKQFANPRPAPAARTEAGAAANPVDLHVGARIRMRRKLLGVSQEKLAGDLGLTFQQVQKYERGANRVSASKLYEIARALRTTIAWFFTGLADTVEAEIDAGAVDDRLDPMLAMMVAPYGPQVAADFAQLSNLDRSIIAGLARRLADGDGDLPTAALSMGLSAEELASPDRAAA